MYCLHPDVSFLQILSESFCFDFSWIWWNSGVLTWNLDFFCADWNCLNIFFFKCSSGRRIHLFFISYPDFLGMYSDFVSDLSGSSVYSPKSHYLLQHAIIITLTIRHCPISCKIKTEMRQNKSGLTDQVNWYLQSHYGFWLTHKSAVDKSSLEKYGNVGGVPTMQYRSSGFKAWNKALGIIFTAMSILSTLLPTSIHNGGMHQRQVWWGRLFATATTGHNGYLHWVHQIEVLWGRTSRGFRRNHQQRVSIVLVVSHCLLY